MKDNMAPRPSLLDLRANTGSSAASAVSRPLRSPRLHVAGEAPPELSPLDAFALQSRLLARQLQETTRDGNRMSRLPPLTLESPLIVQGRSDYFRSMSQDSGSERDDSPVPGSAGLGLKTEFEDAFSGEDRPRSMHPRMSRIPPTPDGSSVPALPDTVPALPRGRDSEDANSKIDFFGARQDRSPSPMHSDTRSQIDRQSTKSPVPKGPLTSSESTGVLTTSPQKFKQHSYDEIGLAPPRTLFTKRSASSIASGSPIPAEDDMFGNMSSSVQSLPPRKLSSGSAAFQHHGSPSGVPSFRRSPSAASESSILPRPAFNFSRPLSRSGTPTSDHPLRQASSDSQPSFILADESAQTPVSMHSEAFMEQSADDRTAAPSYIYSKFSLPRGKTIQRSESSDSPAPPIAFQWEQPIIPPSNVQRIPLGAPPSPPTRPSSSSARTVPDDAISATNIMGRQPSDVGKFSLESSGLGPFGYPSPNPSRPSDEGGRHSEDITRGRSHISHLQDPARGRTPASVGTSDSDSTIRAAVSRSNAPTASEMTAEEHLNKGIECHENGLLNESTYHLRHAARLNDPTGMLLYALACRHGWGMRPNQKEGVQWLRKAAEYASVEIADDEDQAKEGKPVSIAESRTRKAQFALSIYELGVSHMNGWGIEQDKALALRCFEIAGNWGDVDALAETGFCYAQGIGCKKNLKKSAKFYRMAEAKGMSMVGNSWIHKSKYGDDDEKDDSSKEKRKNRSKSRTRTMFGKKSAAA